VSSKPCEPLLFVDAPQFLAIALFPEPRTSYRWPSVSIIKGGEDAMAFFAA
jgi:hypothetical protein